MYLVNVDLLQTFPWKNRKILQADARCWPTRIASLEEAPAIFRSPAAPPHDSEASTLKTPEKIFRRNPNISSSTWRLPSRWRLTTCLLRLPSAHRKLSGKLFGTLVKANHVDSYGQLRWLDSVKPIAACQSNGRATPRDPFSK